MQKIYYFVAANNFKINSWKLKKRMKKICFSYIVVYHPVNMFFYVNIYYIRGLLVNVSVCGFNFHLRKMNSFISIFSALATRQGTLLSSANQHKCLEKVESRERIVLTLCSHNSRGFICLPCYVRYKTWGYKKLPYMYVR